MVTSPTDTVPTTVEKGAASRGTPEVRRWRHRRLFHNAAAPTNIVGYKTHHANAVKIDCPDCVALWFSPFGISCREVLITTLKCSCSKSLTICPQLLFLVLFICFDIRTRTLSTILSCRHKCVECRCISSCQPFNRVLCLPYLYISQFQRKGKRFISVLHILLFLQAPQIYNLHGCQD